MHKEHESAEHRLTRLGVELPKPPPSAARYVNAVTIGDLVYLAGHGAFDGTIVLFPGRLGADLSVAEGQRSARTAALNLLASLRLELGTLDRVSRIVKLLVFVNSTADFTEHHLVANGASDLLAEVLGSEIGRHARSAVGVASLPLGISVEVEAIIAVSADGARRSRDG